MHSFSPLRFDLAKQMAFAVSETSRSHAAVSIGPLEKNLRPASKIAALSRCEAFRGAPSLPTARRHATGYTPEHAKYPTFNIPSVRRGNCPLFTGRFGWSRPRHTHRWRPNPHG